MESASLCYGHVREQAKVNWPLSPVCSKTYHVGGLDVKFLLETPFFAIASCKKARQTSIWKWHLYWVCAPTASGEHMSLLMNSMNSSKPPLQAPCLRACSKSRASSGIKLRTTQLSCYGNGKLSLLQQLSAAMTKSMLLPRVSIVGLPSIRCYLESDHSMRLGVRMR